MDKIIKEYNELNNSFKKQTLIFHLGSRAGFFSEYNNMILAMLYCLTNKIRFVLYSKDAIFGYKEGWNDYFIPFCEEISSSNFHNKYNFRYPGFFKPLRPHVIMYKLFNPNNLLTFELYNLIRSRDNEKKHYFIPELNIDGNLIESCQILVNMTWRYNQTTENNINKLISKLNLPNNYSGLHIRGGDKITEMKLFSTNEYLNKLETISKEKNIFILTDDYRCIKNIDSNYSIYTLCKESEIGYFHNDHKKNNRLIIKESHERLFASIDILSKSNVFVGTFGSNVGMYLGIRMYNEYKNKVFGLDAEQWFLR
jgi:hypothetical protein